MKFEYGDFDAEEVGMPMTITLQVKEWRVFASELIDKNAVSSRVKQSILQMLSEKIDSKVSRKL